MGTLATVTSPGDAIRTIADHCVSGLPSPHTRRIYSARIREFLESGGTLTRESVQSHLTRVREAGGGSVTLNQHLAAIKRFSEEARARRLIDEDTAYSIRILKAQKVRGIRVGNWLTLDGLKALIRAPDRTTKAGLRDAAVFALLAGCGLRRSEAATVEWSRYQLREGRACLVDIEGKGQRVRTVPVPEWARRDLDEWQKADCCGSVGSVHNPCATHPPDITPLHGTGSVRQSEGVERATGNHSECVRSLGEAKRGVHTARILGGLSESGVWYVVKQYSDRLGIDIRPHDLRRTIAHLMRRNGAQMEQIQMMLGHSDVRTTQRYLGGGQELTLGSAAVDSVVID